MKTIKLEVGHYVAGEITHLIRATRKKGGYSMAKRWNGEDAKYISMILRNEGATTSITRISMWGIKKPNITNREN